MALFLENVVANALQEILGQYFDGFEKQRVKLSVLSGDLALKKLRVRKDALDTFLLPFKVKWGEVGEFKLKVPWKRLVKEPVVITLDSVLLLVGPIKQWDHDEYLRMARKAKEQTVQDAVRAEEASAEGKVASNFFDRLAERVIDNITLRVTRVHIRYEDDFANPERPFAVGLTLTELTAVTTDALWHVQAHAGKGPVFKLLTAEKLSLYWNSQGESSSWFGDSDFSQLETRRRFAELESWYLQQLLLEPTTLTLRLKMTKPADARSAPSFYARLEVSRLLVQLLEDQYHDIVVLLMYTDLFNRWCRYRKWLPKERPTRAAAEWWAYALRCVQFDLAQERVRRAHYLLRSRLRERLTMWMEYIGFWSRAQGAPWLEPLAAAERVRLYEIEDTISVAEIIACRRRAEQKRAWQRARLNERSSGMSLRKKSQHSGSSAPASAGPASAASSRSGARCAFASSADSRALAGSVSTPLASLSVDAAGLHRLSAATGSASAAAAVGPQGSLAVEVVGARGLRGGSMSTYCVLYCDEEKLRTATAQRSATPFYNERFTLSVRDEESHLHVILFEENLFSPDAFLGHVFIPLRSLLLSAKVTAVQKDDDACASLSEDASHPAPAASSPPQPHHAACSSGDDQRVSTQERGQARVGGALLQWYRLCARESDERERLLGEVALRLRVTASRASSHLVRLREAIGFKGARLALRRAGLSTSELSSRSDWQDSASVGSGDYGSSCSDAPTSASDERHTLLQSKTVQNLITELGYDPTEPAASAKTGEGARALNSWGRVGANLSAASAGQSGIDLRIRLVVTTGQLHLFTRQPHKLHLGLLRFAEWHSEVHLVHDGFEASSTIGTLDVQGRATRLRRLRVEDEADGRSRAATSGSFTQQASASTVPARLGRVVGGTSTLRISHPSGMAASDDSMFRRRERRPRLTAERSEPNLVRAAALAESAAESASGGGSAGDAGELPKQAMVSLNLKWVPRAPKVGCERDRTMQFELGYSEWHGKAALAPLELMYHHGWVERVLRFFVEPWKASSDMEGQSLIDTMAQLMDSSLEVEIAHAYVLIMNHFVGPNSPLVQLNLRDSQALLEHVVQSRFSANLIAKLDATYYNPRNRLFEPLLEPLFAHVQLLFKTPAALHQTAAFGSYTSAQVRLSPLRLNLTHAFLESLLNTYALVAKADAKGAAGSQNGGGAREKSKSQDDDTSADGAFVAAPFWIRNETGSTLSYARGSLWRPSAEASGSFEASTVIRVPPGAQVALELEDELEADALLQDKSLSLWLHVEEVEYEVHDVIFDKVGVRLYSMRNISAKPEAEAHFGAHAFKSPRQPRGSDTRVSIGVDESVSQRAATLVCEVRSQADGSNLLVARSPLRFRNSTAEPIEILLHSESPSAGAGVGPSTSRRMTSSSNSFRSQHKHHTEIFGPVGPGDTWTAPLRVFDQFRHGFSVRPMGEDEGGRRCAWSERLSLSDSVTGCQLLSCDSESDASVRQAAGTEAAGPSGAALPPTPSTGAAASSGRGLEAAAADVPRVFFCTVELEADAVWEEGVELTGTAAELPGDARQVLPARDLFRRGRPLVASLHAPLVVRNQLAVGMRFTLFPRVKKQFLPHLAHSQRLERGEHCLVHGVDPRRTVMLTLHLDGYQTSSMAAFKPAFRRGQAGGWQRLRGVQTLGRLISAGKTSTVFMRDEPHGQPLQVHVETWETAGACLNLLAYTTHWIVNKTSLPLEFRQKVGMLSRRVADGDGRTDNDEAVGDGEGDKPECMGDVLLPGGASDAAPRVSSPNDTFAYDAGEVTSGPLHVSYSKNYWRLPFHYAATLKVSGDSGWSAPFRLDQLEPATISLQSRHAAGRYELGVVCKWAPEPFQRTQLVYVCPRYVLCNDTRHALQYMQHGAEGATARAVEPESKVVFHWTSAASKPALQVRVLRQNDCSVWSTPFTVDGHMRTAGEYFMLKVRRPASCNLDHLMVTMQHAHPVIFVVVSEGRAEHAPIMIDNQLEEPIRVCQRGCQYRDVIRAKRIMPYAWDFPLERRPTMVLTFGSDEADPRPGFRREIVIDGRPQQVELRMHASAAGPGQTIRICAEPVDCQRLIVRCEAVTPNQSSLFLSSVSRLWYDRAQPLLLSRRLRDEDPGSEWLDVELPCLPLTRRRLGAKELSTLPVAQIGSNDAPPPDQPMVPASEGTRLPTGSPRAQPTLPTSSSPLTPRRLAKAERAGVDADILRYGSDSGFSLRINTPIGRVLPVEAASSSADAAAHSPTDERQSLEIASPLDEPTRRKELKQLLEAHPAEVPVVSALEMWKNSSLKRRQLAFDLSCESIAVSIVDDAPKELLYLTLDGLAVSMSEGVNDEGRDRVEDEADSHTKPFKYEQRLSIQLENLQVDNQRYNTAFPVLLWPIAAEVGQPVFSLHLLRDISFSRPFAYLAEVHIELQPLNVRLDEESVRAYLAFLDVFQPAESAQAVDTVVPDGRLHSRDEFEFTMLRPLPEAHGFKMFIERLYVSRVQLRLSLKRSPSRFDHFSLNPLLTVFNTITTLLINIDDAPITFKALHRRAFFCFPDELTESTQRHYRSEIWRVALAVASSLDAIGKPYESLTDFANALRAAFVRPAVVARKTPARFCPTLFWGLVELVKVCLLVPFNAVSKILQAWAKGLALLALDPDFSQRRQQQIEFRPAAHLGQGVHQGLVRLLEASASAVGGFGLQPAAGWTRGGFWGACLGFSRASVGFVFKLIVGVFDLFAKVFEGVKNTFSIFQEKDRVRPPRAFHMDRVLRPYSEQEARATSLLVHCKMDSEPDENAEHEYYVDHFSISWMTRRGVPGPNKLLLITSQRVVLGDESRLRPEWEVRVERIARVEIKPGHLMLWTWEKVGLPSFTFSYNVVVERLVRCSNPSVLEALFSRLWSVAAQHDRAAMYAQRDRRKGGIAHGYQSVLARDACDMYVTDSCDGANAQFAAD